MFGLYTVCLNLLFVVIVYSRPRLCMVLLVERRLSLGLFSGF